MDERKFKELYRETFDALHAPDTESMEVRSMKKVNRQFRLKRAAAIALLAVSVGAAGTTVVNAATGGKLVRLFLDSGSGYSAWEGLLTTEIQEDGSLIYVIRNTAPASEEETERVSEPGTETME